MDLPVGVPDAVGHTDDPIGNSGRMQACRQPTVTLIRVGLQTRLDRSPRETQRQEPRLQKQAGLGLNLDSTPC